jgi:site-specific recombinase XerD
MLEELQRRNYSQATTRSYILAVKQFAEYFGQSPEKLGAREIRRYQLYLLNEKKLTQARSGSACRPCAFATRKL